MALVALLIGAIAENTRVVDQFSLCLRALPYSGTFLFHKISAMTDGLMLFDGLVVNPLKDPSSKGFSCCFWCFMSSV